MGWGNNSEVCVAVFTALTFLTSALLVALAASQIKSARDENRRTQTLLACGQYDTNPIIFDCHSKLVQAKQGRFKNDEALIAKAVELRLEILTVLNFLDAIAIGIEQGLYIDELARAHLCPIVRRHVSELIDSGVLEVLECPRSCYEHLIALDSVWRQDRSALKQNNLLWPQSDLCVYQANATGAPQETV